AEEARLFKIAVNFPHVLSQSGLTERHLDLFEEDVLKKLVAEMLKATGKGNTQTLASLLEAVTEPVTRDELIGLSFLDYDEIENESDILKITEDCIRRLETKDLKRKINEVSMQLRENTSTETPTELLRKKRDYTKTLKR
ncbi:MAG: hypothetical protein L0213_02440, partial [Candidatus Dadabacteria bacterium]|nr:hypothetical protein [Candidatus Dadabacteria bacterium]